jgi:hypothetical protein
MISVLRHLLRGAGYGVGAEFCEIVTNLTRFLVICRAAPFLNLFFALPHLGRIRDRRKSAQFAARRDQQYPRYITRFRALVRSRNGPSTTV